MSQIDWDELAIKMLEAAKGSLSDSWPQAEQFMKSETKKYLENVAEITAWKAQGSISEEQAQSLMRLHNRSMKMVLTAVEGISLVMAENAINAALDVAREVINSAIGWALL